MSITLGNVIDIAIDRTSFFFIGNYSAIGATHFTKRPTSTDFDCVGSYLQEKAIY